MTLYKHTELCVSPSRFRSSKTCSKRCSKNTRGGGRMAAPNKISHEVGKIKNDVLQFDIHGVKGGIVGFHPLETLCQSARQREEEMKRRILVNTYGTAFPMKMDLDRQILSRFRRPTGAIPSSMLGLEAVTGSLEDFGFEHYLNDPHESETFRPADLHNRMEARLGLSR